nr:protein ACCELERATED CELL DEATH 6-like isoform X2 [Populus alba]XP_034916968.1 protein ACCELERATED CELL DEATH 6-like isoform X2 [Populus alba]XP_034916969.1 protein ACCELERATED CELL DEATH 6-like isoform X2 [Populus alba]XP_034916970.1 protein ACCELERATED CELL DEATH 6-like isoform X2 [Populus alba]
MQLQIDMLRPVHEELERWKAVKFPVPIADYGFSEPNKILQKELYTYAKEDNFNALFGLLSDKRDRVSSEEVLDIIFKHVAASGNSLLHVAASNGGEGVTQLLCHHFPLLITRKNFLGDNALHLAARAGRFDTIQNLVEHVKIDPHKTLELASLLRMKNNKGNTPLHDAVIKGCREVACFLLYEDLEVSYLKNKEDKSPLYLAVESCDGEMLASFIEAMPEGNLEKLAVGKPDIMLPEDKKGGNLLHLAASMGFLSRARLLVSRCPVAASQSNEEGNLPIHVACQKGYLEVVRELLIYWFDPTDFLNERGQNILHVAAESGQRKIVDEILRNRDLKALINEKDYDGNTPLHLAAMYCRSEIVQALVSDKRVDKMIVNNEKLSLSGVVAKLLRGGRLEAPKSYGMNKLIDTKHEDDAARGTVWNKSQEAEVRKMREVLKVLVEADDKTEFDINLIFDSPRTTLTTEELHRGVGNLLVVAVLVVGVTFAGAITVPGSGSDLSSGSSKNMMRAYIVFDMLAMNFSLIAAIILCQISLGRTIYVTSSMEMATYFNVYSLLCMGLAFTFILAITVQERTGFFITIITCQASLFLTQYYYSYRLILSNLISAFSAMARMYARTSLMGRE